MLTLLNLADKAHACMEVASTPSVYTNLYLELYDRPDRSSGLIPLFRAYCAIPLIHDSTPGFACVKSVAEISLTCHRLFLAKCEALSTFSIINLLASSGVCVGRLLQLRTSFRQSLNLRIAIIVCMSAVLLSKAAEATTSATPKIQDRKLNLYAIASSRELEEQALVLKAKGMTYHDLIQCKSIPEELRGERVFQQCLDASTGLPVRIPVRFLLGDRVLYCELDTFHRWSTASEKISIGSQLYTFTQIQQPAIDFAQLRLINSRLQAIGEMAKLDGYDSHQELGMLMIGLSHLAYFNRSIALSLTLNIRRLAEISLNPETSSLGKTCAFILRGANTAMETISICVHERLSWLLPNREIRLVTYQNPKKLDS